MLVVLKHRQIARRQQPIRRIARRQYPLAFPAARGTATPNPKSAAPPQIAAHSPRQPRESVRPLHEFVAESGAPAVARTAPHPKLFSDCSRRASSPRITIANVLSNPSDGSTSNPKPPLVFLCTRSNTAPGSVSKRIVQNRRQRRAGVLHICVNAPGQQRLLANISPRQIKPPRHRADASALPDAAPQFRPAAPARKNSSTR